MLPSRSWGGDPAATQRTSGCGSGRYLSTTPSPPRRRGDPRMSRARPRLRMGVEGPSTHADGFEEEYGVGVLLEMGVDGPPTPADSGFEEEYGVGVLLEMGVEGPPTPADSGFEEEYGVGVLLEMGVEGPPTHADGFDGLLTPVQRYSLPIVAMPCAQTGSGRMAAIFFLPMVNMLAATGAEGGRGGGGARCDMDPYGHATTSRFCLLTPGGGRRAPRTAAFCLLGVNGLVASAAAGEGGGRCSRSPNLLVLAPTRELAVEIKKEAEFSHENLLRFVLACGGTPLYNHQGYFFETVESLKLSHEAIKYLAVNDADWILDERKIRKIAGGIGMRRKSLREALSFVATFPPEIQIMLVQLQQPLILIFVEIKQESNSLAYWLYLKTLPTTAIDGGRNDKNLLVERSRVSVKAIQYLLLDEADSMLDMGCEIQRNDSPHSSISSSRSCFNFWFFLFVLSSLLSRAVSVDTNFNVTTTMDDFNGYCPAPPFQSKFIKSPMLAPTPTPTLNIVQPSCSSLITLFGSILSVLSNCGLMCLINTVETVNNTRRKWVGFSSVFFSAAYQLWILHLYQNEPSDICKFMCSLMLLVLHLSYSIIFWNMRWKVRTIVIGSIFVCSLGGISGLYDGIFAIIFMFAGHSSPLWSARNDLNWASFSCAIIGLIGSVLQSIATGLSFHHMPLYEIGSFIVLVVRVSEVLLHFIYISRQGWAKLFPPEWGRIIAPMARRILLKNNK